MLPLKSRGSIQISKPFAQRANRKITDALLLVAGSVLLVWHNPVLAQVKTDDATKSITALIHQYERSVSDADTELAGKIWSQTSDVSFIHPLGREQGWEEIKRHIYENLMGQLFSERKLTARDISVHAYSDAAWAEFNWVFVAKLRSNGSPVKTEGRETQVYRKAPDGWRLVHVHYSSARSPAGNGGGAPNQTN